MISDYNMRSEFYPFRFFRAVLDGFLLEEYFFERLWVLELGELLRAFEIEPENLNEYKITCSLVQVMYETWSLAALSLRQLRKFLLRKAHSVLIDEIKFTDLCLEARILSP
jgi:hypothetical protein